MNRSIHERVVAAMGQAACERLEGDRVRVAPPTTEACAALLGLCYDQGWQVSAEGRGSWQSSDAPADVVVSLRALDRVLDVPEDGTVILAEAGAPMHTLHRAAADHLRWLPLDPPGHPARTVGSVVATGTAGPLHHLTGSVREQLLGLTVVTGDGRVLRLPSAAPLPLGRDSTTMHVGGFGGFGIITECQLRLREAPQADTTWIAIGDRDRLTETARALELLPVIPAAVELISPALANEQEWLLAVRCVGSPETVDQAGQQLDTLTDVTWEALTASEQQLLWNGSARAMASLPTTFRLGGLVEGLDDTLDLVVARLGESLLSAGAASGTLRWSGEADARTLRLLRATLAAREIPLTLERAPWHMLRAVGHFGAYREGIHGLISALRDRYDPRGVLLTALASDEPS